MPIPGSLMIQNSSSSLNLSVSSDRELPEASRSGSPSSICMLAQPATAISRFSEMELVDNALESVSGSESATYRVSSGGTAVACCLPSSGKKYSSVPGANSFPGEFSVKIMSNIRDYIIRGSTLS